MFHNQYTLVPKQPRMYANLCRRNSDGRVCVVKKNVTEDEVAITGRVSGVHGAVAVVDTFVETLVLEFIPGDDLYSHVYAHETLSEKEAIRLVRKIAETLAVLHDDLKVVHCDIKPDNIMYNSGDPVIVDFGLSCIDGDDSRCGFTADYAAPEVVENLYRFETKQRMLPQTPKRDMWALGVVLYFLLSKTVPFGSAFREGDEQPGIHPDLRECIKTHTPCFPDRTFKRVTDETKSIILALLSKDPADRPSAKDLVCRL
jgi:serine/threonine-protein kinase